MNHDDEKLRTLLQTWKPRPISASEVRQAVWQRIEQQESKTEPYWLGELIRWLGRPAIAIAVFAVAIGIGAAFGTAATTQAQTNTYLQTVSPFRHLGQ